MLAFLAAAPFDDASAPSLPLFAFGTRKDIETMANTAAAFGHKLRTHWRDSLGFALFLGWVYCTLFGCGLAAANPLAAGQPTTYSLERIWMFSGMAEALGAATGVAVVARASHTGRPLRPTPLRVAALTCAAAGSVVVWASWCDAARWFDQLYWIGGLLSGVATAFYVMSWGRRLSARDEAAIEFIVPLSFTISFVLYLAMLVFRPGDVADLVVDLAMVSGSFALLFGRDSQGVRTPHANPRLAGRTQAPWKGLLSFSAIVAVAWIQIAYFRVISTPALAGDRFTHYLYPFLGACLVSCVMLLLCIRISRYLNVALAYRWSMPLFVIAYVPLLVDYDDPVLRMLGYAINFLGMFGVQFGCWLGACKYVRRTRADALNVFGFYAMHVGLGIFAGCALGLFAVHSLDHSALLVFSALLLGCVQLVTMFAGFNPNWVFRRTRTLETGSQPPAAEAADRPQTPVGARVTDPCRGGAFAADASTPPSALEGRGKEALGNASAPAAVAAAASSGAALEDLFRQQALRLRDDFKLTSREAEVAALLLAGRSRPFIRDELFISLNTVGVHARSIFAKCGVHSQQELIDLARGERQHRGE